MCNGVRDLGWRGEETIGHGEEEIDGERQSA